jgi:hypothetical protein
MPTASLLWVWFCAYLNCAGWALSALHELNAGGYAVVLALGAAALVLWRRKTSAEFFPQIHWRKIRGRFRKPFPLAFLILAAMAFLGGALHAPNNYDALAYRVPRMLHWLAAEQWQWIHSDFNRLNTRGCGIEWVSVPFIALFKTDRWLFVINFIPFLLLPGLVFGILNRLGVRRRTAWHWMWLMPTGYGFLLQAGSIGNDLFGAAWAMAAMDFALRARQGKKIGCLWTSILAAGLMTASKSFNILLLLPWFLAVLPAARLLLRRPLVSILILVMAAFASLVPTAILNARHCGDWTGLAAEQPLISSAAPVLHFTVNAVLLVLHNFAPPIFPFSSAWSHLMEHLIPSSLALRLGQNFESSAARLEIGEMQMEETAGLGMGLSLLLLFVLFKKIKSAPGFSLRGLIKSASDYKILVPLGAYAAFSVFMVQSGLSCPARYLAPFYVLLITPLLAGRIPAEITRSLIWQRASLGVFFLAALVLVLSPPRPLWPATSILRALGADHSSSPLVKRAWTVYAVYGARADAFAPARAILPADANPLGLITWDDPEASLWQPFGSRRIFHVCRDDTPDSIRRRGIKYVLVSSLVLSQHDQMTLDEWLSRNNAEAVQHLSLELRAETGPADWFLVRLRP